MDKEIILLADDDTDDTEMFCEALADVNKDIICYCAENGNKALQILDKLEVKPKLIFLDLNMPLMDGWQCLKILKKDANYQDIPVIMISTSSHKNDMEKASDLGAICYFVKPNSYEDLKYVLQSLTSNLGDGLSAAIAKLQANVSDNIFTCTDNAKT
ncbi:response regulator [Pseudomonas shirazensis]